MDIRVVLGCPGGGKAGSQPKDLGGKAGALGGIGEHANGSKGQKEQG